MKNLIARMVEKKGYKKNEATKVVSDVVDCLKEMMLEGMEVKFPKFLSISKVVKKGRLCNIPSTGEKKMIPDAFNLKMKVSSVFKQSMN